MPNKILLKGEYEAYDEGIASGTIYPGMLIKRTAAAGVGTSCTVAVHATAGGGGECAIAIENALYGETITDAYASGERVRFVTPQLGDWLYILVAAGAAAIVYNDKLVSNGDGTFKKDTGTDVVFFRAEEALDNSGGGTNAFIKARRVTS